MDAHTTAHPLPETVPSALPFEPRPLAMPKGWRDDEALADCRGRRVGILVVAYNAVTTLLPVLKRIPPNVWRNVEEVVVFDDASQDATFELAMGVKLLRDLPKLTVLRHARNLGYGGNQRAGYRYMMERGFDVVVLLHGDGQYAPEILAQLYAPIVRGEAEAVFGSRMMPDYGGPLKGGMPLYKYLGNRVLTTLENLALGMNLTEFHSGYRAYSLAALRRIEMERMTADFHFDTEIIIKLKHQGMRIREVPIPTYYGQEICYVNGMKYAGNVARALWRYRRTVQSVAPAPEFAEYWVHYPLKEARHSSHSMAQRAVPNNARVLDIGCGEGFLARRLAERGCLVTGLDSVPEPAARAALESYFQCDLSANAGAALDALPADSYDRVLLLDVLEHFDDCETLLRRAARRVGPGGRIVVSLPNVANITSRLMLLFGRWEYAERGIMDRTHLRFFTRRTARALLEKCGCEIVSQDVTSMPVELVLGLRPGSRLMGVLSGLLRAATRLLPGLLGYQVFLVARRKDSPSC